MAYLTKSYLETQFTNYSTKVASTFTKQTDTPKNTSDLTNDSNFVSDASYVHTDNNYTADEKSKLEGIEAGAQVNAVTSVNGEIGAVVLNDVKYSAQELSDAQKLQARTNIGAGTSSFSGNYNDLSNLPSIPSKTSDISNDSGFITNAVDDLANYYKKTETYTQSEVNTLISNIITFGVSVVEALPTENISTHTIYLVPKEDTTKTGNVYDEYINTDGTTTGWELIGDTYIKTDLTNYYTKSEVNDTFATKASLDSYVLKTDTETTDIDFSGYFA